uniref:O-antigen ligase family protein n=1 Tax=Hylemonella sp. TaxID=2066020 RepID=UPI0035ADD441
MKADDRLCWLLCFSAVVGSSVGYSKIWLFHIVFLAYILLRGRSLANDGYKLLTTPVTGDVLKLLLAFGGWYFLSGAWALNGWYWARYMGYLMLGGGLLLAVVCCAPSEDAYSRVLRALKLAFLFALMLGLLEAFTSFRWPTSPYSDHAPVFAREAIDYSRFERDAQAMLRSSPTSLWGNPNAFALAMVMVSPYFMLHSRRWLGLLGLTAISVVVIMTGSRGAMAGYLVGLALCLLWLRYEHVVALIFLVLCGIMVAPLVKSSVYAESPRLAQISTLPGDLGRYFAPLEPTAPLVGDSIDVRKGVARRGIAAFMETGGRGVGAGGSQAVLEAGQEGRGVSSMHNFWIEVLVDGGVIAILLVCALFALCGARLRKILIGSGSDFCRDQARILVLSLVIFAVGCVSVSSPIYFLPMWILLGLSVALIEIDRRGAVVDGPHEP